MDIRVFSTRGELFASLAAELVAEVEDVHRRRDTFALALAGGSTPRGFYEVLAQAPWAARLRAERIHWFWGDERAVPPDDPASNFGMAKAALLDHLPVDGKRVHRMCGELPPEIAAERYEGLLRERVAEADDAGTGATADREALLFDWVLLGLGADGHTASLFPGGVGLEDAEGWVRAVQAPGLGWRLTLTPRALSRARRIVFLVTGSEKADILRSILEGPYRPELLPAQVLVHGRRPVSFRVDAEAASRFGAR